MDGHEAQQTRQPRSTGNAPRDGLGQVNSKAGDQVAQPPKNFPFQIGGNHFRNTTMNMSKQPHNQQESSNSQFRLMNY